MKKEYADRLVEALRSGRYKQGREQLRYRDQFCCLGVLCDVVKDEVGKTWMGNTFDSSLCTLPISVRDLTGVDVSIGAFTDSDNNDTSLAQLNDEGKTFTEIADVIEKNWEKL